MCVAWLLGLLFVLQVLFSVAFLLYKIKCKYIPKASPSEQVPLLLSKDMI